MIIQQTLVINTSGRGLIDISSPISDVLSKYKIQVGLCNVFLHHTSASIILGENYDPTVLTDLEAFMLRLIPDGDSAYVHTAEGPDDMPSHIRSVLTENSINIPITENKLALGRWQGIFLWEHRFDKHARKVTLTIQS